MQGFVDTLPGPAGDYGVDPQRYANGGVVQPVYAASGWIPRGTAIVPAMLTPGEGVVNRRGMGLLGANGLRALNSGRMGGGVTVNIDLSGATLLEDSRRTAHRLTEIVERGLVNKLKRSRKFSVVADS